MKYCSNCGSAQLETRTPDGDNRPRITCGDCQTIHYQNPKIIVGCLPIYDGKVLLCRRAIEPRRGMWNLPAGFMENGETVEQGAMREVREESGAEVEIERLHSVYNVVHAQQVYLLFLARMRSPKLEIGVETLEARLFAPSELPMDELAFMSNRFGLQKYLENPDFSGVHLGDPSFFSANK